MGGITAALLLLVLIIILLLVMIACLVRKKKCKYNTRVINEFTLLYTTLQYYRDL